MTTPNQHARDNLAVALAAHGHRVKCGNCMGTGMVERMTKTGADEFTATSEPCPVCNPTSTED